MSTKKDIELVSIIMPAFNSEKYISETINSVLNQKYTNWELLIVDDASEDSTVEIIKKYQEKDARIILEQLSENSGAAVARNAAIKKAKGTYFAFLDSDDLWASNKLYDQLKFMKKNNYLFTSTSFAEIDNKSELNGNLIKSYTMLDYNGLLKYCPGNSTVMYNAKELGKFYIPNIRKRNDFVMWLQIIKKAKYIYGMDDALSAYRVRDGSLSKNKIDLVKYQWKVYRGIEKLPILKSFYLLVHKTLSIILNLNKANYY